MEFLQLLLTGATGAAVVTLINNVIQWHLNRKAKKEDAQMEKSEAKEKQDALDIAKWHDDTEEKIDALVDGQKFILLDRIQYLARSYLRDGEIDFDDRRRLHQMHEAYHRLGGNGDLNTLMAEVDEIPLKDD